MSVVANYIGSLQSPVYGTSLTGTASTVYTVPTTNKGLTLAAFTFTNKSGSSQDVEVYHYEVKTTTAYIIWAGTLANKESVTVSDNPVRLRPSDEIRAVGASGVTLKLDFIAQLETQTG